MTISRSPEPILDPHLPIIDPHHHLWDHRALAASLPAGPPRGFENTIRKTPLYLREELTADLDAGHNVRATVYVEAGAGYRADGPDAFKPVGETEFALAVAADDPRIAAAIVGHADLTLGAAVEAVLEAHIAAGAGRFRGIRHIGAFDPDPGVLGPIARAGEGLYRQPRFRDGFAKLAPLGLSFDAWVLEPQLGDVIDLARVFPDTSIILDHLGTPLGIASYAGRRAERFPVWRQAMQTLAGCANVTVKLGGLGMIYPGFDAFMAAPPATSIDLARDWRPYIETCIEAFGASRCMFESNFPVDRCSGDYATPWNAFKRIAAGASAGEMTALFSGTARGVYHIHTSCDDSVTLAGIAATAGSA